MQRKQSYTQGERTAGVGKRLERVQGYMPVKPTTPQVKGRKTTDPKEPNHGMGEPLHARRVWNKNRPKRAPTSTMARIKSAPKGPPWPQESAKVGRGPGYDDARGYVNAKKHPNPGYTES